MSFHRKLAAAWERSGSMLCVGIDPDVTRLPPSIDRTDSVAAIAEFGIAVVDATADVVCAFKPQIAHFAAARAESALEAICAHLAEHHPDVPIVLDAKRGDIGSTAEFYAEEAFGRYRADAVTYNPYLGLDAARPLLERGGVLALCRTSNPGSADLQELLVDGRPLYERVAATVADTWAAVGDCGVVVGATWPEQLATVRGIVGELPILVPGIGAQGGDVAAAIAAGSTTAGRGLLLNSSRQILYGDGTDGDDYPAAIRERALATVGTLWA